MGNILGSFNLDLALTALERQGRGAAALDAEGHDAEQPDGGDQAGRPDPDPDHGHNTASVTFKDAALTLKVTPQITDAGTIILNLEVENNSPDYGEPSVDGHPADQHAVGEDASCWSRTGRRRWSAASSRARRR